MINTITKAISHLKWRFQNGWNPTNRDIESFNMIVDFQNVQHKTQFDNNQLFGKLFIKYYTELLKHYETTVWDKEPGKELNKLLNTDIKQLIVELVKTSNEQELYLKMREGGFKGVHPRELNDKDKEFLKLEIGWLDEKSMTYDEALTNITSMINNALTNYK